jgi:hypothetical protein
MKGSFIDLTWMKEPFMHTMSPPGGETHETGTPGLG